MLLELLATSGKKSLDPSFSCCGNRLNIIAWACMLVKQGWEHEVFTPGLRDTTSREDLRITSPFTSPCYYVCCRYTFGFSFNGASCEALKTITASCIELFEAVLYFSEYWIQGRESSPSNSNTSSPLSKLGLNFFKWLEQMLYRYESSFTSFLKIIILGDAYWL